jgi:hypothetical protein
VFVTVKLDSDDKRPIEYDDCTGGRDQASVINITSGPRNDWQYLQQSIWYDDVLINALTVRHGRAGRDARHASTIR